MFAQATRSVLQRRAATTLVLHCQPTVRTAAICTAYRGCGSGSKTHTHLVPTVPIPVVKAVPAAGAVVQGAAVKAAAAAAGGARTRMASVLTKPFSWQEVKELVERGNTTDIEALGLLGRNETELWKYRAHRAKIAQEYASTTDYLRARLFGAPTVTTEDGKLAVHPSDPTATTPYILVMENEFPYYLEPGVSHYNIWSSTSALSQDTVERLIANRLPCDEYVWFVNPPQFQSIKTIWHCHVMVLNLKDGAQVGKPGHAEVLDAEKYTFE